MSSQRNSSDLVEPLPDRPNLEMQQKRAKALLRAAWAGEAEALARVGALHPKPPAPDALVLSDAQLVVARGYGFESWGAMKRKIESLTQSPVEQFLDALGARDLDRLRALLDTQEEVRAAVNAPIGPFNGRPIASVKKQLPLVDLLMAHGADLNLKSEWWAGGFGLLEYDCTPAEAAPLIQRGAAVDVFAAAHLGMFDRLCELIDRDPALIHARGGDGRTPLHCARTVQIAEYLIARGAGLDVRDVDHESTPAQHLLREVPDVARLLVARGAWADIFIAIGLGDAALVERCLRDDRQALDHRIGQGLYAVAHNGRRASTREEIGDRRGDIYRWVFDHNLSALEVARRCGDTDIVDRLMRAASPQQQLLAACGAADTAAAEAIVARHPDVVSTLAPDQRRLIADRAYANDAPAVALMLDLGFDQGAIGPDGGDALHWAAFHGNVAMLRSLLQRNPRPGSRDAAHGGTPLDWCCYGAVHGWSSCRGDFATAARLLVEAGERIDPANLPTGRDDVDAVLREKIKRGQTGV